LNKPSGHGEPGNSPDEFIARLEQAFFAHATQPSTKRRAALAGIIADTTAQLTAEETASLVEAVKSRLHPQVREQAVIQPTVPAEEVARLEAEKRELESRVAELKAETGIHSAAYAALASLSNHFLGEDSRFEKPEQIDRFCSRIKDSFQILLSAFKSLLRGRKRFQMEYAIYFGWDKSMDGTRVIRAGENKDVGRKFFEWQTMDNFEASSMEIARALDELKYHELALLSGYKKCVKEGTLKVIQPLSPERLRQDLANEKVAWGPLRVPFRLVPFKRAVLYREFSRRYRELVSEDERYFEDKFRNTFRNAYKEVMNLKIQAQQKGKDESRDEEL